VDIEQATETRGLWREWLIALAQLGKEGLGVGAHLQDAMAPGMRGCVTLVAGQRRDVLGVFNMLGAVVAARMVGHERLGGVENADAGLGRHQGERLADE